MSHLYDYTHIHTHTVIYKASIHAIECPKFTDTTKLNSFNIKNMILTTCYSLDALTQRFPVKLVFASPISLIILHSSNATTTLNSRKSNPAY